MCLQVINWRAIVQEHGPVVWRTAYRLLGDEVDTADCFQDTFVSALQVCQRQRVRNFAALLVRLATARAIDQLRQRVRRSKASELLADCKAESNTSTTPCQQLQTEELAAKLREAVARLPEQEAQAFCLRYLSGMSYRLIAKQLGVSTSGAGVALHRARAKLRRLLESNTIEQESEARS
jgi:RNA polymerase sigma-70 factor (ECF subfamily)